MNKISLATIKDLCSNKSLRWTDHIMKRLFQRGISMDDVECALLNGEIIECYPEDYPYQSCLVLGMSANEKQLHIVCGISDRELWLITVYYPDKEEWESGCRTRKANVK